MDQSTNKQTTPKIVRLNNDFTNRQLAKQSRQAKIPKMRYLGLILITIVLVLTIPTYGLIKSYQSLQDQIKLNQQTLASSKQLDSQTKLDKDLVNNMKIPAYEMKYARSQYFYTKPNEKVFKTSASSGSNN